MSTQEHRLRTDPDGEGLAWLVRYDTRLRHRDGRPRVARIAREAGIKSSTLYRTSYGDLRPSGDLMAKLIAYAQRVTGVTRGSAYTHLFDIVEVDEADSEPFGVAA